MSNSNQKPYNPSLADMPSFYVLHADANHLNAQDVIHHMVSSAKNISIATWNCFDEGVKLVVKDEIVADLIFEIQTKLEMIEELLPMAFDGQRGGENG